jgi:hypothetical protein
LVANAQRAGPDDLSGRGLGDGPAAVVAQHVIVPAGRGEAGIDGGTAAGVFDGVVGVGAVRRRPAVGSTCGAVPAFRLVRFRRPPSEPDVRVSPHPALHEFGRYAVASVVAAVHGFGMLYPRYRYRRIGIVAG